METATSTTSMDNNPNGDFSMTSLLGSLSSTVTSSKFDQMSTEQMHMFVEMADRVLLVGKQINVAGASFDALTGPIFIDLVKLNESSGTRRQQLEDKIRVLGAAPPFHSSSSASPTQYIGAVVEGYSQRLLLARYMQDWSGAMIGWVVKTAAELEAFMTAHRGLFDKLDAGLHDFEERFCHGAPTGDDKGLSNVMYALETTSIQEQGGGKLPEFEIPGSFVEESEYNKWPDAEQASAAEGARLYKACVEALKYE